MGVEASQRLFLMVAEHASMAPDGTVTIVRGGLDRYSGPTFPLTLHGILVIWAPRGTLGAARVPFTVTISHPTGVQETLVSDEVETRPDHVHGLLVQLLRPLPQPGAYMLRAQIGDVFGELEVQAVEKAAQ